MTDTERVRIAIVYPGDQEARRLASPQNNRFSHLFRAFADRGLLVEPAVYHDECCEEVCRQLLGMDVVLVWVNPIEGGRDRTRLDAMLRTVSSAGVIVSTHPDIIMKIGTKEVLYNTRYLGWGCDTHLYSTLDELRDGLQVQLAGGKARVLKQYRGHSGIGVWKVQLHEKSTRYSTPCTYLRVRHAMRGCVEEEISLDEFLIRCNDYFKGTGRIIDQEYQERLTEGMIRCYLVHQKVVGFGHQAINALYPAPQGALPNEAPQPSPRLYHDALVPEFQHLKRRLEQEWVPELQQLLEIETSSLPVLWDCDFLLGAKRHDDEDTYVLCEINASSVAPFPDSAVPDIVEATIVLAQASRCNKNRV